MAAASAASLNEGIEKHIYEHDTVIIGESIDALLHSFINDIPIIYNIHSPPPYFDLYDICPFNYNGDLYDRIRRDLSLETDIVPKIDVWNYISSILGLKGLSPLSDKVKTIRIQDNLLKIFTNNSKVVKFRFNNLVIFDDRNVEGIPEPYEKTKEKYRVLDWYKVLSGCIHENHRLADTCREDFVKDIYFYPSERNPKFKHLVAVSYMTEEQLTDPDYSEIYIRYKILDMMEKAGISGRSNGIDKKTNKQKRLSLRIEFQEREVLDESKILYKEVRNITFRNKAEDLWEKTSTYQE
jgi:hypothetical protein